MQLPAPVLVLEELKLAGLIRYDFGIFWRLPGIRSVTVPDILDYVG
jgi:hypothetical protein